MSEKTEKKRAELRTRLVDLAQKRVAEAGIQSVRARDLAKDAGCAVGAIYTVFADLNELVMAVNARTFRALGTQVTQAVNASEDGEEVTTLIVMAHAYLDFARTHTHAWRTLFDLEMSTEQAVPKWYLQELQNVFALIETPLSRLYPELSAAEVQLMTRGLFSSIHGIVLLGLERRISAVPVEELERMITLILTHLTQKQSAF